MILSFLLTFLTSGFLSAIMGSFLYFFVIFISLIILNIEILSLFKVISPLGIILLNIIFFITVSSVWLKKGCPGLLKHKDKEFIKSFLKRCLNSFKLDKGLIILAIGVLFLIIISFIMCALLPVNEPDAVFYHTYRALVWAQKGYIHHFDTIDIRNLVMPINSELIYTWIFSLTRKDFGFGFLEFFSYIFGLIGFFSFFERFKFSYRKRLWAIFIYSSFAAVTAQISSTQTDLFTGVLLFYSLMFFFDFIDKKDNIRGYFSSLSFAVALGVKSTAFMAGLAMILVFLIYSIQQKSFKSFIKFIILTFINFMIFSSYNYILNFIDFSNPLGSKMSIAKHGFYGGIKGFIANFITYNIQLFDFSGFMWGIYLSPLMVKIQNVLFNLFHIEHGTGVLLKLDGLNSSLNESEMGYGVVGILTFLPSVLYAFFLFIKNIKNKTNRYTLYIFGPLFYLSLIVLSFAVGYMIYSIRFILTFYTICMPVLVFSYFKKNNFYKTLVVIFALYSLFLISTHLAVRPFNSLVKSYKTENSFEDFADNVRCMEYSYFKKEFNSCAIIDDLLLHIEEYKTAGIFTNNILPQHTVIHAANKHVKIDELLLIKIKDYKIENYDYLLTHYPYQFFDTFNKDDERAYFDKKIPENCYLIEGKPEAERFIVLDKNNDSIENASKGFCMVPYEYIKSKGFIPVYETEVKWKSFMNRKENVSTYIIWKNIKQNY